jgi:hypothetical protein
MVKKMSSFIANERRCSEFFSEIVNSQIGPHHSTKEIDFVKKIAEALQELVETYR